MKVIISIVCIFFTFAVTGCGTSNMDLPPPEGSSTSIESPIVELDSATKEEYHNKYIKPLSLSRALEMEWEEPNQLFSTEVQMVGYFVQGFSSDHDWNEIWEKSFSKETSIIYIPQETAERIVRTYFNIESETIQMLSPQYNSEKKAYEYYGAMDSGTEDVIIKEVKKQDDTIVITCEYSAADGLSQSSSLTIRVNHDGAFQYVSNRLS